MTDALDQTARSALERFIQRARRFLEEDLARHAEGRFGIHATDGAIEDEDGLHLSPDDLAARRDIVDVLHFIRREEPDHPAAVSRLVREAAFTHLNRLVAIRIAEAIGLLPESIANGSASAGYRELLEVAPLLAHDASGGYWRYLQLCGDELAADLPQLFDPRNPLLELTPSPAAFDALIDLLTADDLNPVWDAPDALGWAYQFFNSGDERRAMRDASPSPRNPRELAVRNQFFTPRYVVDFLVHNSLGRRLLDADPTSPLIEDLPLLLDPPTEPGEPLGLADVRVLDPACGSGHFLLGAYDVLERAWHHAGVEPDDAAPRIVASLWGIDIDPRCAQVAAAAVILRARRACRHHDLPTPNIICARALPEPTEGWDTLLAGLPEDRRQLVATMRDALDQAPVLGPLLKVEERLASEIHARVAGADDTDGTLFAASGVANDAFGHAEADVLAVLRRVADQTTSTPAERLFAAEADDAIRFVEALRHRYDAVLMNPPFGEPVSETKAYLKRAYSWLPSSGDLLAAFVGRGVELLRSSGSVGAITSRAGLFLKTFERWRSDVLLANSLVALADLGGEVMEQAMVEAAAYVIRASGAGPIPGVAIRLLRDVDRREAMERCIRNRRDGGDDERLFSLDRAGLAQIPGQPIAYWATDHVLKLFIELPRLEGNGADIRIGSWTGDDFRRVRLWWEVAPAQIGREMGYVPYAKGGEYSPFYSEPWLVVAWDSDRGTFRDFYGYASRPTESPHNVDYYFRPGLTWPRRTNSGFGPRVLPAGCIFADKGPAAFVPSDEPEETLVLLGWLMTRLVQALIDLMVAAGKEVASGGLSRSYEVGIIQSLPWPGEALDPESAESIAHHVRQIVQARARSDWFDETTRSFRGPGLLLVGGETLSERLGRLFERGEAASLAMLESFAAVEREFHDALGLDESTSEFVEKQVGPFPLDYQGEVRPELARDICRPIDRSIRESIADQGGSRAVANLTFFADRRLEVLSHIHRVSPGSVADERRRLGYIPPDFAKEQGESLFSFAVGVLFGRWHGTAHEAADVSTGSSFPFEELQSASPAMLPLHGAVAEASGGSGAGISRSRTLWVDELGGEADLVHGVVETLEALLGRSSDLTAELQTLLGARDFRQYLRTTFFSTHLSRYSRSRRKAPVYWPLYVPSGRWGVWVYAQRFTRETIFAVASAALRREGHADVEIERLERARAAGGSGRGVKALDKALDDERKLAEELRRFRQEAERIAGLGWEPDLDDGIVLCAAPLADLFPQWRKELAGYRDELRAGNYEWSTVSKWADQL